MSLHSPSTPLEVALDKHLKSMPIIKAVASYIWHPLYQFNRVIPFNKVMRFYRVILKMKSIRYRLLIFVHLLTNIQDIFVLLLSDHESHRRLAYTYAISNVYARWSLNAVTYRLCDVVDQIWSETHGNGKRDAKCLDLTVNIYATYYLQLRRINVTDPTPTYVIEEAKSKCVCRPQYMSAVAVKTTCVSRTIEVHKLNETVREQHGNTIQRRIDEIGRDDERRDARADVIIELNADDICAKHIDESKIKRIYNYLIKTVETAYEQDRKSLAGTDFYMIGHNPYRYLLAFYRNGNLRATNPVVSHPISDIEHFCDGLQSLKDYLPRIQLHHPPGGPCVFDKKALELREYYDLYYLSSTELFRQMKRGNFVDVILQYRLKSDRKHGFYICRSGLRFVDFVRYMCKVIVDSMCAEVARDSLILLDGRRHGNKVI